MTPGATAVAPFCAVIDFSRNYFELFDLPQRYRVDAAALDAAYREPPIVRASRSSHAR